MHERTRICTLYWIVLNHISRRSYSLLVLRAHSAGEDLARATAVASAHASRSPVRSPMRSPMRLAPAAELPRSRSASPNPVPLAPNTDELVRLLVETEMDAHQAAIQVAALQEALKVFREVRRHSMY